MKILSLLTGVIFLTLLAACSATNTEQVQETASASSSSAAYATSASGSELPPAEAAEGGMLLYTDPVLGFSISLPKETNCSLTIPVVEIGVFEDHASNRDFIAFKKWDKNTEGNSIQETTLKQLQTDRYWPSRWEMISKKIHNDHELEAFIQQRYGKDCLLGEKKSTQQEGTYDVKIDGWRSPEEGDCFVNYATVIRYSPSRQQVISWNMGQDVNFVTGTYPNEHVYDDDIVQSFRFLR